MQTSDTLVALTKPLKARCVCLYGGASKDDQSALLKGGDVRIIVATPGRLIDMINDKAVSLDKSVLPLGALSEICLADFAMSSQGVLPRP
jgi:superfamily II DNA/RNA helicase